MKKLFGKILVGAIGCVMALGLNAFAAGEINITSIAPNKDTGKVVISGTITSDAAESTILVAPEGVSLLNVKDDDIKYIDQQTANSGKFDYEFVLETGKKYNVWFGGTDIVKPGEDIIDLTAATSTFKIVGSVSLIKNADVSKVTVTAGEKTVNVDKETSQFALEVEAGTYDVVVGRTGYLYRTFKDVVVDGEKDLGEIKLLAGDFIGTDSKINLDDLNPMLMVYNSRVGGEEYNADADLNDDGVINLDDLNALLLNYNATASSYAAE